MNILHAHYRPMQENGKPGGIIFWTETPDAPQPVPQRGVRWDSDHVVTFNDDLQAIAHEIVRAEALERVHIGLDYFDASINRVAAWTIGARNTLRALLNALLEPMDTLKKLEVEGDFSQRLAMQEELKAMPSNAVWDYYCMQKGVPVGVGFMDVIKDYEKRELSKRS